MGKSQTIRFDDFGTVLFERSRRAKRLGIRVRPFHDIRVTVPARVSFRRAQQFVESKRKWLTKQHVRVQAIEREHQWRVAAAKSIDREQARDEILQRLNYWSYKHQLPYNRLYVRAQTTRWGSCSGKNNINLNFQVMLLSQDLRDYVMLHELTHTKVRNHSLAFWTHLGKYYPEPKAADIRLRDIPIIPLSSS